MKSVGIDIGTSQIKIVEIQTSSKGYFLAQAYSYKLSQSGATDSEIEILSFLKELAERYDSEQTRFNIAMRQNRVVVRHKNFPFADRLKIQKSIAFELEEDIPFSAENSVFDAKIIRAIGNTAEVLACATPKLQIKKLLQTLRDSGIEPYIMSTEASATANIYERWADPIPALPAPPPQLEESPRQEARAVTILLNMGHTHTIVMAFDGQSLVAARSILWGGRNIADAIAKKYSLPLVEATKEMELKGFILNSRQEATYEAKAFSEVIAKSVKEMVRDLQLSLLEIKSELNAHPIRIEITGGVSNIQGLGAFLTQQLEVPVNRANVLDLFQNSSIERTDFNQSTLSVAIGLALEGLRKSRNPSVNFLKGEFARSNDVWLNYWHEWGHSIKVAGAFLLALMVWTSYRVQFAEDLSSRGNEALKAQAKSVARLTKKNATEANVRKYINDNKKKVTDLKNLESLAGMNSALDILKKVSDAAPHKPIVGLDVKNFYVQDNQVTIEGYLNSFEELSSLQKTMSGLSLDGKFNSRTTNLPILTGKTSFSFSFLVDRNVQKAIK